MTINEYPVNTFFPFFIFIFVLGFGLEFLIITSGAQYLFLILYSN